MSIIPNVSPKAFSFSAIIVGYLLIDDLTANEQVYIKGHLLELIGKAMQAVSDARHYAQDVNLLDSQDYLNFEDTLNQISVADPNK